MRNDISFYFKYSEASELDTVDLLCIQKVFSNSFPISGFMVMMAMPPVHSPKQWCFQ